MLCFAVLPQASAQTKSYHLLMDTQAAQIEPNMQKIYAVECVYSIRNLLKRLGGRDVFLDRRGKAFPGPQYSGWKLAELTRANLFINRISAV